MEVSVELWLCSARISWKHWMDGRKDVVRKTLPHTDSVIRDSQITQGYFFISDLSNIYAYKVLPTINGRVESFG